MVFTRFLSCILTYRSKMLMKKLSNERCFEYSTCTMFFSTSLTFSMMARLLSATLIREFFMWSFTLVISWMPLTNSASCCHEDDARASVEQELLDGKPIGGINSGHI